MELNITRHDIPEPTPETQIPETTTSMGLPTLEVDPTIIPKNLKPLERQMHLMAEYLVERALEKYLDKAVSHLKKEARLVEDKTLTHTTQTVAQAQKKFAASIEEMVDQKLLPNMTSKEITALSHLLQANQEAQTLKDTVQQRITTLQETMLLEKEAKQLQQASWNNTKYTSQEATQALLELVSKYLPADKDAAKQSSLQETEELLMEGRIESMAKSKKVSDKETYLQNTPVYRAVLLFKAASVECESKALCGRCPFRNKGEECMLWKFAFALHDIAFYRAQSISQEQYENTTAQKLVEAQIEISSLKQQLSEEQTKSIDLQEKLDKLSQGSKHLTAAKKKQSEETDYETELDPYLRFR